MKITLDIDKLLEEGRIDVEDYEILLNLASTDSTSTALNILLGFGVAAVSGGMLALLASSVSSMAIGAGVAALGVYLSLMYAERWKTLGGISVVIGSLMFGGGLVAFSEGGVGGFLILTALFAAVGAAIRNSLLIALSAFALLGVLGAATGYSHASYFVWIENPALTIMVFALLAVGSLYYSQRLDSESERIAVVFGRTSLFIANMGFWIGSLWGDNLFQERDYWARDHSPAIPDSLFAFVWAISLIALGIWASHHGRKWVLNLTAVFGAIHFYTQWFERLGASPGSVVLGGIIAIAITLGLIMMNKRPVDSAI